MKRNQVCTAFFLLVSPVAGAAELKVPCEWVGSIYVCKFPVVTPETPIIPNCGAVFICPSDPDPGSTFNVRPDFLEAWKQKETSVIAVFKGEMTGVTIEAKRQQLEKFRVELEDFRVGNVEGIKGIRYQEQLSKYALGIEAYKNSMSAISE